MNYINNSPSRNDAVINKAREAASRPKSLLVVYNPIAGWRRPGLLEQVVAALESMGARVVIRRTSTRGDAERLARAARDEGYDRLLVAGGDGTINEAVNALAGSALPLAIVPMGTANVLATEIGLEAEARAIAETALDGPVARIALGQVQGRDAPPRLFTLMAGVGFDAEVVRSVDPRVKQRLGKFAYVLATLKLLLRYRTPRYVVHANGRQFAVGSVVLANGRHYGGAFVCAPEARLDRSSLELCLMQARGRRAIVRYALALALGRLHRQPDVEIIATREATIEGREGDPIQGDGDILGVLPARIAIAPETLLLAVPDSSPLLR